jgi:AcrR family transcriptional regulator
MYTGSMDAREITHLSGRQAQAAHNDQRILDAARAVFTADPQAPISAVADRAGVGISALYRRYRSKEDLLRQLSLDGLYRFIAEAEAALADEGDPWQVFARFMRRVVDADTHALTLHLAGTYTPTDELWREGARAGELGARIIQRAQEARVLRAEIEVGDLTMLFEQLAAIGMGGPERATALRQRYLALMLEALRAPGEAPLPGSPPTWEEISGRFAG